MANTTVAKPTLTHFYGHGRAEVARLILEDAGVDYDFVGITNWALQKPMYTAAGAFPENPPEIRERTHESQVGKAPFGQLPIYEEPGLVLVQSGAIARYLARKHGYYGTDSNEAALIDQATEGVSEMAELVYQAVFIVAEDKRPEAKATLVSDLLPGQLDNFTRLLERNGNNGYLVGSQVSSLLISHFFLSV
jgi:hypothetical protein